MKHILAQHIGEEPINKIIVIDERPIFRSALVTAVSIINQKTNVIEVSDVQSLDTTANEPAIVLFGVDRLSIPQIKGHVSRLKQDKAFFKIILYDFGGSVELLSKYLGLGVDGFLTRFFDNDELERCLKAVMTDRKYLSDDIVLSVFDSYRKLKTEKRQKLSKTENVVARHLIVGRNVSWIAKY